MYKLVWKTRSMSCRMEAASSGGKARSSRTAVTNCAQQKMGRRPMVMPEARMLMVVTRKLIAPKSEEVMMITMASSHTVCPGLMMDSGGYEVQPDCAAPP